MNTLNSLVLFLSTVPGRDRSCRIFQYGARTIAGLQQTQGMKDQAAPYNALSKQLGLARKVLRFGREINLVLDSLKLADQATKEQPSRRTVTKLLKLLGNLALLVYFLSDHLLFLHHIRPFTNKRLVEWLEWVSNAAWLVECLASTARGPVELSLIEKGDHQATVTCSVQLVKSIVDGGLAYAFLKPDLARKETIGAFGTLTSLLGSYLIWK